MVATPEPSPEVQLIERTRMSRSPKMSARSAATAAGMSDGRWRQIAKGYQATGGGNIPTSAPADTLARMAVVVGVHADAMREAGRDDVADLMVRMSGQATSRGPDVDDEVIAVPVDYLRTLRRMLSTAVHSTDPAAVITAAASARQVVDLILTTSLPDGAQVSVVRDVVDGVANAVDALDRERDRG